MSARARLVVVTERGRVVGTQRLRPEPGREQPVTAVLRAGPGQKVHVLDDVEVPDRLEGAEAIGRFHATVERLLRSSRTVRRPPR